jgi:hypothetical protein
MNEAIEYHNQLFADLVENLQNAVAAGVMLKDEYKQHMTQAYLDLQERIAAELEIDEEDIYDVVGEAAYSAGDEVAEFSVGVNMVLHCLNWVKLLVMMTLRNI